MSKAPILLVSLVFCGLGACAVPVEEPLPERAEGAMYAPRDDIRLEVGEAKLSIFHEDLSTKRASCKADLDCDDGNPCTRDSCDLTVHGCTSALIDGDGDGYAPASLGACGHDCDDGNALVNPAQTAWFTVPYLTPSGERSFDYDCDGTGSLQHPDFGYCIGAATKEGSTCSCTAGWRDGIPECGTSAEFAEASKCGVTTTISKLQGCR